MARVNFLRIPSCVEFGVITVKKSVVSDFVSASDDLFKRVFVISNPAAADEKRGFYSVFVKRVKNFVEILRALVNVKHKADFICRTTLISRLRVRACRHRTAGKTHERNTGNDRRDNNVCYYASEKPYI